MMKVVEESFVLLTEKDIKTNDSYGGGFKVSLKYARSSWTNLVYRDSTS